MGSQGPLRTADVDAVSVSWLLGDPCQDDQREAEGVLMADTWPRIVVTDALRQRFEVYRRTEELLAVWDHIGVTWVDRDRYEGAEAIVLVGLPEVEREQYEAAEAQLLKEMAEAQKGGE